MKANLPRAPGSQKASLVSSVTTRKLLLSLNQGIFCTSWDAVGVKGTETCRAFSSV